jgi:hypothetical protein
MKVYVGCVSGGPSCPAGRFARQKLGAGCRNSRPARVVPRSVFVIRATRHASSSLVCKLVRMSFCEQPTSAVTGTSPPFTLTLMVSVCSWNGSSPIRPYKRTGMARGTRVARRCSRSRQVCFRRESRPRRDQRGKLNFSLPTATPGRQISFILARQASLPVPKWHTLVTPGVSVARQLGGAGFR